MKIGIMTFHAALNTGAVLQAYALQTYLESLGHNVEFINFRRKKSFHIKQLIGKSLSKTINKWEDYYQGKRYNRNFEFGSILNRGNQHYATLEELQSNPPNYDVYIAGSDQVWNVGGSATKIEKEYYLDFGSVETKRIAYAASLGQCNIPKQLDKDISSQLKKFNSISVRELNGVEYIQSLVNTNQKVHHISDPTFLLKASDYKKLLIRKEILKNKEKYITSYILADAYSTEQFSAINYIKKKLNLPLKNLRNPQTCERLEMGENMVVNPMQWLQYLVASELVICCSFHAVVFSLILHKPFIVISPYANQRILSLLSSINLQNHCIINFDSEVIDNILSDEIDWSFIDKEIGKLGDKGAEFLSYALN